MIIVNYCYGNWNGIFIKTKFVSQARLPSWHQLLYTHTILTPKLAYNYPCLASWLTRRILESHEAVCIIKCQLRGCGLCMDSCLSRLLFALFSRLYRKKTPAICYSTWPTQGTSVLRRDITESNRLIRDITGVIVYTKCLVCKTAGSLIEAIFSG
jgi:hypothetical protein